MHQTQDQIAWRRSDRTQREMVIPCIHARISDCRPFLLKCHEASPENPAGRNNLSNPPGPNPWRPPAPATRSTPDSRCAYGDAPRSSQGHHVSKCLSRSMGFITHIFYICLGIDGLNSIRSQDHKPSSIKLRVDSNRQARYNGSKRERRLDLQKSRLVQC